MTEFNENLFYTTDHRPSQKVSVSMMTFPGGEVGVNINAPLFEPWDFALASTKRITLTAKVQNSNHLMAAFLATDALRRVYPRAEVDLVIPYFPYARQDRVCNSGEALSVQVVARLINAQSYATVTVVDPHSPVLVAALDRCYVIEQARAFYHIKREWAEWTIVAPDTGATKKTEEFAKLVGAKGVLQFNKTRELSTGKITGMHAMGDVDADGKYLVLDDICDGGRTFVELVKCISYVSHLELAVTHGIFSKGIEVLTDVFDHVYTTDTLPQGVHPKLTVVNL